MTGCGHYNADKVHLYGTGCLFTLMLSHLASLSAEKYDYVGRLLKPGDEPSEYTDEEDIKDHLKHD